jgi:hypothetical protein
MLLLNSNENNDMTITKVEITFSECNELHGKTFPNLAGADAAIDEVGSPDLGCWKTDFEVHFSDGEIYRGTYSVGVEHVGLYRHIINHVSRNVTNKIKGYKDFSITHVPALKLSAFPKSK